MGLMKDFDIRIRGGGDDAIAAVSELMAGRWIPVSERLPEDFDEVLVTNGLRCLLAQCSKWKAHDTPLWMSFSGRCYPTHWMPLPKPPTDAK